MNYKHECKKYITYLKSEIQSDLQFNENREYKHHGLKVHVHDNLLNNFSVIVSYIESTFTKPPPFFLKVKVVKHYHQPSSRTTKNNHYRSPKILYNKKVLIPPQFIDTQVYFFDDAHEKIDVYCQGSQSKCVTKCLQVQRTLPTLPHMNSLFIDRLKNLYPLPPENEKTTPGSHSNTTYEINIKSHSILKIKPNTCIAKHYHSNIKCGLSVILCLCCLCCLPCLCSNYVQLIDLYYNYIEDDFNENIDVEQKIAFILGPELFPGTNESEFKLSKNEII